MNTLPILAGPGWDLYGSTALDVAPTGSGQPIAVAVSPRSEVVASAGQPDLWDANRLCKLGIGFHSRRIYRAMDLSPAVNSSFEALRAAVLAGKVDLLPAVDDTAATEDDVDAEMAAEICASNRRLLLQWDTPLDLVLHEMMGEAMKFGCSIPEVVFDDVRGGTDDGLWAIRAVKPKPGCRFQVDQGMNVVGIRAPTYNAQGEVVDQLLAPDHFAPLTWDGEHGDPRGRSCYRFAVNAWRNLEELWPDVMEGWKQFGVPLLVAKVPRDLPPIPVEGGPAISPMRATTNSMVALRRNRNLAIDEKGDLMVVESSKDSSIVAGAIGELESQIIKSLLLTTRGTVEAKHGSRADSETAQDVTGTRVRFLRKWLERWVRGLLIKQNTYNYGPDIARRLTPLVDLGSTEHQDFAANAAAVAQLAAAKLLQPSQYPAVCTMLGLPIPTKVEIAALTATLQAQADPAAATTVPQSDGQEQSK